MSRRRWAPSARNSRTSTGGTHTLGNMPTANSRPPGAGVTAWISQLQEQSAASCRGCCCDLRDLADLSHERLVEAHLPPCDLIYFRSNSELGRVAGLAGGGAAPYGGNQNAARVSIGH